MKPKRVLVCGGRDFGLVKAEYHFITCTLDSVFHEKGWEFTPDEFGNTLPNVLIISGEAKGADSVATEYAMTRWTGYQGFPAQWDKYGRGAGHIRNQQMIDEGKPDLVIAFPGGRGTADMVTRAKGRGIEVIEVKYE